MKVFDIWISGYLSTGMEGVAQEANLLGSTEAGSFQEACDKFCSDPEWQEKNGRYDRNRLTVWGCGLYDNEKDARKSFG